jgi:hypothetical protein
VIQAIATVAPDRDTTQNSSSITMRLIQHLGAADELDEHSSLCSAAKNLQPSEKDRELGRDKTHIEIDDQCHSGYGGVMKAHLRKDGLVLTLTNQAATRMFVDETIEIDFVVADAKLIEIGNQLRLLFGIDKVQVDLKE